MTEAEKPIYEEHLGFVELANELEDLQSKENGGRGVSCVRSVAAYLKLMRLEDAAQIARHDADKIENYPAIKQHLKDKLFVAHRLQLPHGW